MNGHVRVPQYLRLAAACLIYDVMFERGEWITRLRLPLETVKRAKPKPTRVPGYIHDIHRS